MIMYVVAVAVYARNYKFEPLVFNFYCFDYQCCQLQDVALITMQSRDLTVVE